MVSVVCRGRVYSVCVVCAHVVVFVAVRSGSMEGGTSFPPAGHRPGPDSFLPATFVIPSLSSRTSPVSMSSHLAGRFLLPLPGESD